MGLDSEITEKPGRRALVTGGAVRVGRAICLTLGKAGYRVAVHYRTSQRDAAATVRDLKRMGGRPAAVRADLGRPEDVVRMFEEIDDQFGGLDLLVNGAAIFPRHDARTVSTTEWDDVFAVNVRAAFQCCQEAARRMGAGSSIVNLTDTGADEAWPSYVPYVATKAALVSVTRGLARAWAPEIRVNAVAPGPVLLPESDDSEEAESAAAARTVLGRIGSPDDVANAVLFLDRAVYVTGEVIRVDGGHHLK
ncbi:MAG: SDR family oxidoreductase [Gemmatimonadetes bacterium]|nr:SDR family oxidoreductase [Gemmatimonadota bacterium]